MDLCRRRYFGVGSAAYRLFRHEQRWYQQRQRFQQHKCCGLRSAVASADGIVVQFQFFFHFGDIGL